MRAVAGMLVLGLVFVLLFSPCASEAQLLWSDKDSSESESRIPAAGAAKEATKEVVRDAADAAKDAGETIKQTANAAYETTAGAAKTITGGTRDESSTGPTGAAYRDSAGKYIEDMVSAARDTASDATEAVKDGAARATQSIQDTTRAATDKSKDTLNSAGSGAYDTAASAGEKVSQTASATKDAAVNGAEGARDTAGRVYDSTAETVGAGGNKVSDTAGSAKDKVLGTNKAEESGFGITGGVHDAAGNDHQSARDMATRTGEVAQDHASYAGAKISETAQAAADTAQRAGQVTREGAANTYNSAADSLGYKSEEGKGYGSQAYGAAGDYYGSARDSTAEYYEGAKNRLGSIIEILGWHKAAEEEHSMLKGLSPYDIVVGNTKYVWHQKPGYFQRAKNTVGQAASTAGQKLGGAGEYTSDTANQAGNGVYEAAVRAKDRTVDTANRASEGVKDMTVQAKDSVADTAIRVTESAKDTTGRAQDSVQDANEKTTSTASDYSQKRKDVLGAGAAAIGFNRLGNKMDIKGGFFPGTIRFLEQVTFSITYGSAVWMTFISGALLSKSIPREQFRSVQTKMFPYFLKFVTGGELGLLVLYSLMSGRSRWHVLSLVLLVASSAFNAFVLEPETTKIYFERLKLEKEEGRGLNESDNMSDKLQGKTKKFNEIHGFSTILNLLGLIGLTLHAWHLTHGSTYRT